MAKELQYYGTMNQAELTVTAEIYNESGVRVGSGVPCPESGGLAIYIGDMPDEMGEGVYGVRFFDGTSLLGQGQILWDGEQERILMGETEFHEYMDSYTGNIACSGSTVVVKPIGKKELDQIKKAIEKTKTDESVKESIKKIEQKFNSLDTDVKKDAIRVFEDIYEKFVEKIQQIKTEKPEVVVNTVEKAIDMKEVFEMIDKVVEKNGEILGENAEAIKNLLQHHYKEVVRVTRLSVGGAEKVLADSLALGRIEKKGFTVKKNKKKSIKFKL